MIRCECHGLSWDQCPALLQEARDVLRDNPNLKTEVRQVLSEGMNALERMRDGMEQIIKDAGLPQDRTDALCRSLDPPLCPCCNTTLASGDCPKCGGI